MYLKGVFAKNEKGYRPNAKNKCFWSLLILFLSVAFIRKKLVKNDSHRRNTNSNKFRKLQYSTRIVRNQFNSDITINGHRLFFDALVFSWYFIMFLIFYDLLLLKTFIPVSRIFDKEDDIYIFSRNVRKSSASENYLKIKQNQKYCEILTIYECVEKNNRWLLFVISEWFVWNYIEPRWMLHLSEFLWTLRSSVLVVFNNFLLIDR